MPVPIPDDLGAAPPSGAKAQRLVWVALVLALATVSAVAAWHVVMRGRVDALPVYGTVPRFDLVERSGRPLSSDDFSGKVWVASFIFTRCGGICPALTTNLAALLRRYGAAGGAPITAVSFSVDPTNDDPATLRAYATRFGADALPWLFATGEQAAVEHLVRDGFRLAIATLPPGEREQSPEPITHSDRLVLVDRAGRIRGYYHGNDADGLAQLERDLASVARAGT